jgi:hypothetical protein
MISSLVLRRLTGFALAMVGPFFADFGPTEKPRFDDTFGGICLLKIFDEKIRMRSHAV